MLIAAEIYGTAGLLHQHIPEVTTTLCLQAIGGAFGALAAVGVLCQYFIRKYRSHLVWKQEESQEIVRFAFSFGVVAKRNWYKYREKQDKEMQDSGQAGDRVMQRVRDLSIAVPSRSEVIASWLPD